MKKGQVIRLPSIVVAREATASARVETAPAPLGTVSTVDALYSIGYGRQGRYSKDRIHTIRGACAQ